MCGCFVFLAAAISPRLADFFVWAFTDRMSIAFNSFWIALAGFIFLPWTMLAWAIAYAPVRGVTGFGWFVVGFAFIADVTTHVGSMNARRQRRQGSATT